MKESLKALLKRIGLYDLAQRYYYMYQHYSPERLRLQFRYRFSGAPDGHPVPPPRMVHKIIARGWAEQYWNMGSDQAEEIITILRDHDIDPDSFEHILDFGCGCGRVLRHFSRLTNARLNGSDYNPKLIRWCQKKLPLAEFYNNGSKPPLPYEDESFDFIYLISVLTHMGAELQKQWMAELQRVTKPGGYIFFTTHGDRFLSFFDEDQQRRFEANEIVLIEKDAEGTNHFGSFQSRQNVENHLLDGFELVAFVRGEEELKQDTYIVKKL